MLSQLVPGASPKEKLAGSMVYPPTRKDVPDVPEET